MKMKYSCIVEVDTLNNYYEDCIFRMEKLLAVIRLNQDKNYLRYSIGEFTRNEAILLKNCTKRSN